MSEAPKPGRQLTAAARSILLPLGCTQIGRFRLWIANQRFWAIVIEFKPSSFSKGSYLNVGACWLWHAKDHRSFDHGYRADGFNRFGDERQFATVAESLALRAADEVQTLRTKFASLAAIARELTPKAGASAWAVYHAAVAAGLAGDVATAERLFDHLIHEPTAIGWHRRLQADSAELAHTLPDRDRFREAVRSIIQKARSLHKLPPDPTCLETA